MQFTIRFDIVSAILAYVFTRDIEFTRLAFAIWHVR